MSKAIWKKLKAVKKLPRLISSQQTAYVKNRLIGESDRSISDIFEISERLNIERFLVTMDIEKALTLLTIILLFPSWENLDLAKILSHGEKFYQKINSHVL